MEVPYIFRIFWIAPMLGGALLMLSAWNDIQAADASAQWQRIDGRIIQIIESRGGMFRAGGRWGEYAWEYDGKHYTGSEVDCCSSRNWSDVVEVAGVEAAGVGADVTTGEVSRIGAGARIDVFINPENPERAVLMTGTVRGCYVPILVGLALMMVGMWIRKRIMSDDVGGPGQGQRGM